MTVGGETAGEMAGETAGAPSFAGEMAGENAGMMAGDQFGISPVGGAAGEGAGERAGDSSPSAVTVCGDQTCDPNAMCVSGAEGPRCQCDPRYEGDGVCAPIPCPPNASGAPNCACNDGYEGTLTFELSANEWMGRCRFINPCELISIREENFIETSEVMVGETIYEACIIDDSSTELYRFAFEAGEVYRYYGTDGSHRTCDESVNENQQQDRVNAWPYSGGVLTDAGLFHVRDLTYTVGECTYDVLGVMSGSTLDVVYLAPTGRTCNPGDTRPISCGEGVCRSEGVMRCESGEWVEDCTPGFGLNGL